MIIDFLGVIKVSFIHLDSSNWNLEIVLEFGNDGGECKNYELAKVLANSNIQKKVTRLEKCY